MNPDTMNAEQLSAAVAEKVFGWKPVKGYEGWNWTNGDDVISKYDFRDGRHWSVLAPVGFYRLMKWAIDRKYEVDTWVEIDGIVTQIFNRGSMIGRGRHESDFTIALARAVLKAGHYTGE